MRRYCPRKTRLQANSDLKPGIGPSDHCYRLLLATTDNIPQIDDSGRMMTEAGVAIARISGTVGRLHRPCSFHHPAPFLRLAGGERQPGQIFWEQFAGFGVISRSPRKENRPKRWSSRYGCGANSIMPRSHPWPGPERAGKSRARGPAIAMRSQQRPRFDGQCISHNVYYVRIILGWLARLLPLPRHLLWHGA